MNRSIGQSREHKSEETLTYIGVLLVTNVPLQSIEPKAVINVQCWDNHTPIMNGIRPSSHPIPSPKSVPAQSPKSGSKVINLKENIGEYVQEMLNVIIKLH